MTEHVVISKTLFEEGTGRLRYHDATFDGETFHAECGADERMDVALLVRLDDIEFDERHAEDLGVFVDTDTATRCRQCKQIEMEAAHG